MISLCGGEEGGDHNIEEGREISLCREPNMEQKRESHTEEGGDLSRMEEVGIPIWRRGYDLLVWEGRGRGSQYGRGEYDLLFWEGR